MKRTQPSRPMRILNERNLLTPPVLDYGCGYGMDADTFGTEKFDPAFFPFTVENDFQFQTITCIYVLNILPPEKWREVFRAIKSRLKSGGTAYFAVRRDIEKDSRGPLQWWVELPAESIFKSAGFEIYRMRKWREDQQEFPWGLVGRK